MAVPTKLISTSQGFQDAKGTVVALGLLSLTLSQNAEITASNGQVTTEPLYFQLDANGKITSTAIWFNDELTPSGTTYRAILYAANGMRIIQDFGYWSIAGASADLSTMIPTSIGGASAAGVVLLAPSGIQTVVQPSGTSLNVNRFENIRFADQFATLQAACDDTPAGGMLFIPSGTTLSPAAAVTLSKDIYIIGANRSTCVITSASGLPVFSLSGTIRQFKLANITFNTNGGASSLCSFSGVTSSEGRISIENCIISGFGATAFTTGTSTYMVNIEKSTFSNITGGAISIGLASDTVIDDCFFENPVSGAMITIIGPNVRVSKCTFIRGSGASTDPDILINAPDASGNLGGYIWILDNKFGNETEINTRYKIQVNNATTTFAVAPCVIRGNNFLGVAGQTCIRLDNQIRNWLIDGNYFGSFGATGTLVSDAFAANVASFGESVFSNNRIMANDACPTLFTNGGRGFWRIDLPENAAQLPVHHSKHEAPELRNRIAAPSEDFTSGSWVKSNLTITASIADPYGTTRASTLTVASGTGNVSAVVTNTNMLNHMNLKVWLQAGTLSQCRIGIKDTSAPAGFQELPTLMLSATWKQYDFDVYGLTPGHNHTVNILLDAAGTINIFAPDVSDWGGDYIPTPSTAMVTDTTAGARHEKNVRLGTSSKITEYAGVSTAGQGVSPVLGATSQKAESAADTNVLTLTPPAIAGKYRLSVLMSLSAANAATLGWTATWTDSNGNAKAPTNLSWFQVGAAAPALTFTTSTTDDFYGSADIDINNAATNIVIKLTFAGTSFTGKMSATIERVI